MTHYKAGVIGWPISHSLSPRLHGFWLHQMGIEGRYDAVPVEPDELGVFIGKLADHGYAGVNVTVPHKQAVMDFCDRIEPLAKRIGAVNTIVVEGDGSLTGSNTDHYGFKQNLVQSGKITGDMTKGHAVVLGAGGASRAVCTALEELGFSTIHLLNRTVEKAEEVADELGGAIRPGPIDSAADLMDGAGLLVNTTSLGMKGQKPLEISLDRLPKTALVTDIVYNPLMTDLLQQAEARGNPVVDGLGMLLYQAIPGFKSWFRPKEEPQVTPELRDHMLAAL